MHYYWFWSFWWLIFPIMGFAFSAFGMWMGYRAHRDRIELLKTYAAQGKDPEELAKIMGQTGGGPNGWGGPWGAGPWGGGGWGPGWAPGYSRWGWGPARDWRRFITFACLSGGFYLASQYADIPGAEHAFVLVSIIMGVLAAGSLAAAVMSTLMANSMAKNDVKKNGP